MGNEAVPRRAPHLAAMFQKAYAQAVKVECDLEEGLPLVSGSPASLRQVLLNLATNALQTMPNGGVLCWRTRHDKPQTAELFRSDLSRK